MSTEAQHVSESEASSEDSLGTIAEVEVLGPCKKRVKAIVPEKTVQETLDRNYSDLTSTVQLPGFRRGRVPRRLLEKRFGEEIRADVKESLLNESFAEIVKEKELKILGAPRFDKVEFAEQLEYEVEIQVHPEFELPDYKGIQVEYEKLGVEESEIAEELERLRKRNARWEAIDPVDAKSEDRFIGDYKLFEGEDELASREKVSFVPSAGYLESFEVADLAEKLESWDRSTAGTAEATALIIDEITVPEFYSEEALRGRTVRLEFRVSETRTQRLPELDDELAKQFDYESVDALRDAVREQLEARAEQQSTRKVEEKIVEKIVDSVQLELPEELIDRQRKQAEERAEQEAITAGKTADEAAEERKKAGEKAAADLARELKEFFVLERIGDKEKIFATEDEVGERVRVMAMVYGLPPEAMLRQLRETGRLDEIRFNLRNEKVRAFLRKKAEISGMDEPATDGGAPEGESGEAPAEERQDAGGES